MRHLTLLFACGLLGSCATRLHVSDITEAETGSEIGGIPFKLPEPYRVAVFQKTTNDDQEVVYEEVYSDRVVLASRSRTYAVHFDADFLSDHSLSLEINPDGTLTTSSLTSDSQADEALAALGEEFRDLEDAKLAVDNAEAANLAATEDEADQAAVAALQAMLEVQAAEVALRALPDTADAVTVQAARARVQLAKLQANLAFKSLGRPQPYPEVTP